MRSRTRQLVTLGLAAAGVVGAGTAAGVVSRRRVADARRTRSGHDPGFGTLRSRPLTVVADDGVRLHAEVDEVDGPSAADASDPTLVFVHGYALNLDCWHFQRAHLRGRRRLVFYDQRSHGRSGRSERENATIDQLGHDVKCVLEQLVPDGPVVLVGHSMGGMTAMAFADHHPELFGERVVGVALLSTSAGGLQPHRVLAPMLPKRVVGELVPRAVAGLARVPRWVEGARRVGSDVGFVATALFAFGDEVPAPYVDFVDGMLAQTPFEVLAEFFPHFADLDKFEVLSAFGRVPTLVLCGSEDRLTSVAHSRKIAGLVDGAELVECRNAGHMVILERHEQVNDALDRLVKQAEERVTAMRGRAGAKPEER